MRVSYLWLKSLLNFSASPQELAEALTMIGLEVESLEPVGPELEGIYVGHVLDVKPHPNADKLTLCRVDIGDATPEVVCGAPNVAAGQKIAFIGAGTSLPNGMLIEARNIRGIPSEGMICSGAELGLSEDTGGILVLDPDTSVGQPLRDVIGPRDWALEIEVTINRPDCLSHIGVVREAAAALDLPFSLPEFAPVESGPPVDELTSVTIDEPAFCPRYSARVIRGVKIAPSPDWLRWRLEAVGLRAINNIVDVTNYVMLEMGHPMHAFDFDRLAEHRIHVRRAEAGQKFITLDEEDRRLDDRMLLICDGKQGVALAGVMGGENSEISDETTNLLLESAYFDPINTRRTSRLLNLSTDSSRRFERGADPNATVRALDMAASLILELAGGKLATGVADMYPAPVEPKSIELRPQRVQALLGVDVPSRDIKRYLENLGCSVTGKDPFSVMVPTFRPDLEREIDLVEEVARLFGYNNIPTAERANVSLDVQQPAGEIFQARLRDVLIKLGFTEIQTSPLLAVQEANLPDMPAPVKLKNPGSEDMAYLCNGLLPGLLKVTAHNLNRGVPDLRLFEIGRGFRSENGAEIEWDSVAGVMVGVHEPSHWDQEKSPVGFLDLKGVVENLRREISLDNTDFFYYNVTEANRFTSDVVKLKSEKGSVGLFGQINPAVVQPFDIDVPVFYFEFDVATLEKAAQKRLTYRHFPKYPPLQRDLAFTLKLDVPAGKVLERIRELGGTQLMSCDLFDLYRGHQVGEGNKSLAFRLHFQSPERTLTDNEVDERIKTIVEDIEANLGGKLRS
jgi:phenylalanyl-tRNA synthetase beta chain